MLLFFGLAIFSCFKFEFDNVDRCGILIMVTNQGVDVPSTPAQLPSGSFVLECRPVDTRAEC